MSIAFVISFNTLKHINWFKVFAQLLIPGLNKLDHDTVYIFMIINLRGMFRISGCNIVFYFSVHKKINIQKVSPKKYYVE